MFRIGLVIVALMYGVLGQSPAAADAVAEANVAKTMFAMFDRPENRLSVAPVVVVADHAIAGWSQGDMGGRALLRRKGHEWQIVLCSGDQLKSVDTLIKVGLPHATANELSTRLAAAEAKVDPARLVVFARFDGIVMMDASGHHPPVHHGGGAHPPGQGAYQKPHGH